MDAKRVLRHGLAAVLVLAAGCVEPDSRQRPSARDENNEPLRPRQEPPQVVESQTDPNELNEDSVTSGVIRYIKRVDQAFDRRNHESEPTAPAQLAADEQPVEEPTPTTAPITVLPPPDPNDSQSQDDTHKEFTDEPATADASPATATLQPPVIESVTVLGRGDMTISRLGSAGDSPAVNSPAAATAGPTSLRDFVERVPLPEDASFTEQLDRRLLRVVVGDYEEARLPLRLVTAEQQELASAFIDAWIAIRQSHDGDLAAGAARAATELNNLQAALRSLSDLSIPVIKICKAVRGFGQYDEIDPPRFLAGVASEFVLYAEVRDFVSELRDDDHYHSVFDLTTTILDDSGQMILELEDNNIVDRCRNRRHDCFLPRLVPLPATLSPGRYVAKVTIVDTLGEKVAESRVPFEIVTR